MEPGLDIDPVVWLVVITLMQVITMKRSGGGVKRNVKPEKKKAPGIPKACAEGDKGEARSKQSKKGMIPPNQASSL